MKLGRIVDPFYEDDLRVMYGDDAPKHERAAGLLEELLEAGWDSKSLGPYSADRRVQR